MNKRPNNWCSMGNTMGPFLLHIKKKIPQMDDTYSTYSLFNEAQMLTDLSWKIFAPPWFCFSSFVWSAGQVTISVRHIRWPGTHQQPGHPRRSDFLVSQDTLNEYDYKIQPAEDDSPCMYVGITHSRVFENKLKLWTLQHLPEEKGTLQCRFPHNLITRHCHGMCPYTSCG